MKWWSMAGSDLYPKTPSIGSSSVAHDCEETNTKSIVA